MRCPADRGGEGGAAGVAGQPASGAIPVACTQILASSAGKKYYSLSSLPQASGLAPDLTDRGLPSFGRSHHPMLRSVSMIAERSQPSHPDKVAAVEARRWHGDESMCLTSRAGSARSPAGSDRTESTSPR
jgi:hypothetical protein